MGHGHTESTETTVSRTLFVDECPKGVGLHDFHLPLATPRHGVHRTTAFRVARVARVARVVPWVPCPTSEIPSVHPKPSHHVGVHMGVL